jgi:hypothetical protein
VGYGSSDGKVQTPPAYPIAVTRDGPGRVDLGLCAALPLTKGRVPVPGGSSGGRRPIFCLSTPIKGSPEAAVLKGRATPLAAKGGVPYTGFAEGGY